jgi:hypothetical protein
VVLRQLAETTDFAIVSGDSVAGGPVTLVHEDGRGVFCNDVLTSIN